MSYISANLLAIGLIIFTLAEANTSPSFSILGVVMTSGVLIMDAFTGNVQEAIFTINPDTTQTEMFCSTVVGLPIYATSTDDSYRIENCLRPVILAPSILMYMGWKAVTLLLSYMIFTKPSTEQHGTGLLLIATGIILKMVPENQVAKHAKSIKKVNKNYKFTTMKRKVKAPV
ncbi:hypothetical protein M0R45_022113 [Rubus argutus]|uniref:Uncharacterized protein n=1 Tax=Rubus argutus TaxID=59490 RepID=A0AAW1XGX4_RUBAR